MKIGFCGSMSVGKSTLVKALAKLPEFKDYETSTERSAYLKSLGIPLNTTSTIHGQVIFMGERVIELLKPNIITDRTMIDVIAFTALSKDIDYETKKKFNSLANIFLSDYDKIFYIPIEIPMEDNGVRETNEEYRWEIDNEIRSIARYWGTNMVEINGTLDERIAKVKKALYL